MNHASHLKRQLRRSLTIGGPSLALGLGAAGFALFLGLDYTGLLLLGLGVILAAIGVFLLGVAALTSLVLFEGWVRSSLHRRSPRRPEPATPADPVSPSEAPQATGQKDGPLIF